MSPHDNTGESFEVELSQLVGFIKTVRDTSDGIAKVSAQPSVSVPTFDGVDVEAACEHVTAAISEYVQAAHAYTLDLAAGLHMSRQAYDQQDSATESALTRLARQIDAG